MTEALLERGGAGVAVRAPGVPPNVTPWRGWCKTLEAGHASLDAERFIQAR